METTIFELSSSGQGKKHPDTECMYIFAYGSLLQPDEMQEACPSTAFVMRASLPNYQVQFREYSVIRQGGLSSIIDTPGELVRGVIYSMKRAELEDLDVLETVPTGMYKRENFIVLGEDREWYDVDLYRASDLKGPFTPAKSYLEEMIAGAQIHGLDPEYTATLVAMRQPAD